MVGSTAAEKAEAGVTFGLWKAEAVRGTRTDLALLGGSSPQAGQGEATPAWAPGSQVTTLFLYRGEDSALPHARWAQRRTRSAGAKGSSNTQPPPACRAHQSSAGNARRLHPPLARSPREGCDQQPTPAVTRAPRSPAQGPSTHGKRRPTPPSTWGSAGGGSTSGPGSACPPSPGPGSPPGTWGQRTRTSSRQ